MAKKRPLSAEDVADWFVNKAASQPGEVITPLETQRLVYFSQAWQLANKGRPLFDDDFEAWATGPINRLIFDRYENFFYTNIPAIETKRVVKGEKLELLNGVWERYGAIKGEALDAVSREPGGPWDRTRGDLSPEAASTAVIPKDMIRAFYAEKLQ